MPVVGSVLRQCSVLDNDALLVEAWIRVHETDPVIQRIADDDWAELVSEPGTAIAVGAWKDPESSIAEAYQHMTVMDTSQPLAVQIPAAVAAIGSTAQEALRSLAGRGQQATTSVMLKWAEWAGATQDVQTNTIGTRLEAWFQCDASPTEEAHLSAARLAHFFWFAEELRSRSNALEQRLLQLVQLERVEPQAVRELTLQIHATLRLRDSARLGDRVASLPEAARHDAAFMISAVNESAERITWLQTSLLALVPQNDTLS